MTIKKPNSRAEAIKMMQKRQRKIEEPSEAHLQMQIVKDFADKFPEKRGALFLVDNNSDNAASMSQKLSQGLVAGVSDLLLLQEGKCIGCELKTLKSVHKASHCLKQAEWIRDHCHRGGFIVSVEMFWDVYYGRSNGISPEAVIDYIKKTKIKTICFGVFQK